MTLVRPVNLSDPVMYRRDTGPSRCQTNYCMSWYVLRVKTKLRIGRLSWCHAQVQLEKLKQLRNLQVVWSSLVAHTRPQKYKETPDMARSVNLFLP